MNRYFQVMVPPLVALLLGGCGVMRSSVVVEPAAGSYSGPANATATPARTPIPGGSYTVEKGDTLYSIAFRKGVDVRDLAQWNGIAAPYTIWPGQRLTLAPGSHVAATPAPAKTSAPVLTAPTASAPVFQTVPAKAGSTAAATATSTATAPGKAVVAASATSGSSPAGATSTVVPVAGQPTPKPAAAPPKVPVAVAGASRAVSGVTWHWPTGGKVISGFKSSDAIPGIEIAGNAGDPVRAAADGVVVYSGDGLVGYGELVIIKHNDSLLSAYGHNSKRLVKEGQRVSAGQKIAEIGSSGATRNELEFQIRKNGNPVDPMGYLPAR